MKQYKYFYIALFFAGCLCNREQEFPNIITNDGICDLYDIAKFEIYKNSSNSACSCSGFLFNSHAKNDTLNILSCDLQLDTMYQSGDTTTMFFSFINKRKERVYYINDIYNDCFQCIGIQFINKRLQKAFFAEEGYLLYNDSKFFRSKDSLFTTNIKNLHKSIDNNFLKKYVTQKNQ